METVNPIKFTVWFRYVATKILDTVIDILCTTFQCTYKLVSVYICIYLFEQDDFLKKSFSFLLISSTTWKIMECLLIDN